MTPREEDSFLLFRNFEQSAESGDFLANDGDRISYLEQVAYWSDLLQCISHPEQSVLYADLSEATDFLALFTAAHKRGVTLCLGSEKWGREEKKEISPFLTHVIQDGKIISNPEYDSGVDEHISGEIWIKTGGSTGKVRFARHTTNTLLSAVWGWLGFLNKEESVDNKNRFQPLNAWITLPLFHVSGLMTVVRAMATGGKIFWGSLFEQPCFSKSIAMETVWLSVVPTQLYQLLDDIEAVNSLALLRGILVGGATLNSNLAQKCIEKELPIYTCYGMTETAAMISALPKQYFYKGVRSVGFPLEHVQLEIQSEGKLAIKADSLHLGYVGKAKDRELVLKTEDLASYDKDCGLRILGRETDFINTGGEKVHATEVEQLLQEITGLPCCVVGMDDDRWGQKICALLESKESELSSEQIDVWKSNFSQLCAPWKFPKKIKIIKKLPVNKIGKIDKAMAVKIVKK